MITRKHLIGAIWSASLALLFTACAQTNESDGSSAGTDKELAFNYLLLESFFYHPEKLRSLNEYATMDASVLGDYGQVLAMYNSLEDPYTRYFTPDQVEYILSQLQTAGSGALVGITLEQVEDTLIIRRVVPDSPAQLAGIHVNDRVLQVNGASVVRSDALEYYSLLAEGGEGTRLDFLLLRDTLEIAATAVKKDMMLPSVYLDSLESVPVIQMTEFKDKTSHDSGTVAEFRIALHAIAGAPAAVLDLRGNGGGSVDQCLAVADEIIPSGILSRMVVHYYDDARKKAVVDTLDEQAKSGGAGENIQWVFLADGNSASCAEILLWAAMKNLNTPIVGDTTYGKGVGQYYLDTYAAGLAGITAMQFFSADWKTYNKVGIAPTYRESDPATALAQAVETARTKGGLLKSNAVSSVSLSRAQRLAAQQTARRTSPAAPGGAWKVWKNVDFEP